ncbi:oligosaccharide flippase family protein [Chitinophaga oryziterrae]|uniref:Oligosaccharide flippase family protein n=1 Tax=Chitinophaga oryziterrae TaxID=1031224 RepID=A0A6N8J6F4_9BACT|nr:lipopolysaccharide biosynthesis protein [Chitinophaga oryziterrae]MVT40211.1 oligosaccharide flippase family protein [Chitinophaga oryziterrae]
MSINQKLIRDTLLYATGPILSKVISILIIPYYSFILAKNDLGYYDLVLTSSQLIMAIITLKISDGLYRWLMESKGDRNKQISAVSNSVAVIIAAALLIGVINYAIPISNSLIYRNLICVFIITSMLLGYLQQFLRGLGLIKMYTYLSILNGILLLFFNVILLALLHLNLQGILLSLIFSNTVCIFYILFRINFFSFIKIEGFNGPALKEMILYSAPLVYNAISWWLMGGFDRYIIAGFLGLEANGIYAIAVKFSSVIILVNSFFIPAWQDLVLKKNDLNSLQTRFNKMLNYYIGLLLSLTIVFSSLSKILVTYLIEARYYDAWKYIPILLVGGSLLALTSFMGSLFVLAKNTYNIFITSLLGSIINILISLLLITRANLYGPCLGIVSGFLAIFLVRYAYFKKRIPLQINIRPILGLMVIFSFITGCLYFGNPPLYYLSILVSLVTFLLFNRKPGIEILYTIRAIFLKSRNG